MIADGLIGFWPIECALQWSYNQKFVIFMLLPLFLVFFTILAMSFHKIIIFCKTKPNQTTFEDTNGTVHDQSNQVNETSDNDRRRTSIHEDLLHIIQESISITRSTVFQASCVFLLFLVYPAITSTLFGVFKCTDMAVDGQRWLLADLKVKCGTTQHRLLQTVSAVLLVVYAIGIPIAGLISLLRNMYRLEVPDFKKVFGFLYDGYHPNRVWWEIVVLIRKLGVTFCAVFITDEFMQIFAASWLIFFALVLQMGFRPFTDSSLNRLEVLSLVVVYVSEHIFKCKPFLNIII